MINYQRLDTGTPNDVEVSTDDSNAEMAALDEMVKACEFEIKLPDSRDDDGNFRFTLPGPMVGEFSDCVEDIDRGKLAGLLDEWNRQTLAAEAEQA